MTDVERRGILCVDGCEVIDNDHQVKMVLRKITQFPLTDMPEQSGYYTITFVYEDGGWQRSDNEPHNFSSINQFIGTLENIKSFSEAVKDLKEERK